jgi:hypothetical protein
MTTTQQDADRAQLAVIQNQIAGIDLQATANKARLQIQADALQAKIDAGAEQ